MNTPLFHAACVAAIEDEIGWVVGLADREHDARQYLQFQRGHASDSQDHVPGLDTVYVEKDDQSNSCYGGIESVDLGPSTIKLKFDDAGSQSLGLDKNVLITFDADERTLDSFRRGMAAIFAGTGVIRDSANE